MFVTDFLRALLPMSLRSWLWRRRNRPERVGLRRPAIFTRGTVRQRLLLTNHLIGVNDSPKRVKGRR